MKHAIIQPSTHEELAKALSVEGKKIFFAGGTDIMIRLRLRPPKVATIIDLSQMNALKACHQDEMGLHIGAMCTMTELEGNSLIQQAAPVLALAAAQVGSTQIRNRATVGGNVANAAQCADTIPALIALNADVELMNRHGVVRSIPVEDFVTGIGKTLIGEAEVITGFFIPAGMLGLRGGYGKIGSRKSVTIAKINGAGVFSFERGSVKSARVALGSLGQRSFFSSHVSQHLTGMTLEQLRTNAYLACFEEQVDLAIPGRDSQSYKRSAVRAVAEAIIGRAVSEKGGC